MQFLENYDGLSESVAFAQNAAILQIRMDLRRDHIIIDFEYFQIQKGMLQTVRADKADVVICLISMFPSSVMVNKLSKKGHFKQFWADVSKKSKYVKASYIYESESSHYTLSENAMVYRCLGKCLWDIRD